MYLTTTKILKNSNEMFYNNNHPLARDIYKNLINELFDKNEVEAVLAIIEQEALKFEQLLFSLQPIEF